MLGTDVALMNTPSVLAKHSRTQVAGAPSSRSSADGILSAHCCRQGRLVCFACTPSELRPGPGDDAPIHTPLPSSFDSFCASDAALLGMDLGDDPIFHVGDWVEVMRLDGDDVRYGEIVACWARLSPAERCGFESWYRINFGSELMRNEMDVPDTEIVDALPQ